jgi:transcriptional regulator with XRE-family HTH domain
MLFDIDGTRSLLGRCVSAEIRARMAALRTSGKTLAGQVGMSQNYLATRLRDEKPFTLDDLEAIILVIDVDVESTEAFVADALARHSDAVWAELTTLARAREPAAAPARPDDAQTALHSTTATPEDMAAGVGHPRSGPRQRRTQPSTGTARRKHR